MASIETEEHTYADPNTYYLPNDSKEQDRLDEQHIAICKSLGGRVALSHPSNPKRVLDIGCGTGACTVAFAAAYPSAQVYGIDLTPVPESRQGKPQNVTYLLGNVRDLVGNHEDLRPGTFDFIYSRLLIFGMKDWPGYLRSVAELAAPGAWIEMQETVVNLMHESDGKPHNEEWMDEAQKIGKEKDMDYEVGNNLQKYMQDAGLVDVHTTRYKWPCGQWMVDKYGAEQPWYKDLYEYFSVHMGPTIAEFCRALMGNDPRYDEETINRFADQALHTFKDNEGGYFSYCVTIGRKPL